MASIDSNNSDVEKQRVQAINGQNQVMEGRLETPLDKNISESKELDAIRIRVQSQAIIRKAKLEALSDYISFAVSKILGASMLIVGSIEMLYFS